MSFFRLLLRQQHHATKTQHHFMPLLYQLCRNKSQLIDVNLPLRFNASRSHTRAFLQNRNLRQDLQAFSSTITPSIKEDKNQESQRYLCRETFPVGSLGLNAAAEMVTAVKSLTSESQPKQFKLAFELIDRLAEEVEFQGKVKSTETNSEHQQPDLVTLKIPNSFLHDVVKTWRSQVSTDISPGTVFEKLVTWKSLLSKNNESLIAYNMVMQAAVVAQDPDLAQHVLDYLLDGTSNGDHVGPDVVSFRTVIHGWTKSGRQDAAARAESMLRKMIEVTDSEQLLAQPLTITFNNVMLTWANSTHEQAPQRAEELLREMEQRHLVPDTSSYFAVLTAWKRSKQDNAADRANAILKHMISLYEQGSTAAKPDVHCFSALISAYARRGDSVRAEQVLVAQCQRFLVTGDRAFLPDGYGFNTVIHAWAKSGRPEAPQMAEAVLQRMQDLAEASNEISLKPKIYCFNSVLHAWARSKDRNAPLKCEAILQRMQYLHENGIVDCQPDVISFNIVLDAWAKSSHKEAPERAEAILRHMIHLNEIGKIDTKPNITFYTSVMDAWSRSGRPNAGERAQALFDELIAKFTAGDRDLKPIRHTFGTLITAWGRSKRRDSAMKAQGVFDDMVRRYRNGDEGLKPNGVHFTALIDAWGKAGEPDTAEQILLTLESDASLAVKPDYICYSSVMNAWSRSGRPDAGERAQALFDSLTEKSKAGDRDLKPSRQTYSILLTAWARSKRKDSALKAQAAFDDMVRRYRDGDAQLKPDAVLVSALIVAWVKAGSPDTAQKILRAMESDHIAVDVVCYNAVMNGWARSSDPDGFQRAQLVFDEMMQKYEAGARHLQPTSPTFDIMIRACLKNGTPAGLQKAQTLFDNMKASYNSREAAFVDMKPLEFMIEVVKKRSPQ